MIGKLQQRWHERSVNFHNALATELEDEKMEKERAIKERMARDTERKETQLRHIEGMKLTDVQYF